MPTWKIEYPNLLESDRITLNVELELIRNDPMLTNCEVTESQSALITTLTASFLGLDPEDPRVAEIMRRKGTLQLPVNVWMPLQVSRLVPNENGRYEVARDNEPRFSGGRYERPDRLSGQRADVVMIDDMVSFNREFPLRVGDPIGIDPATGRVVPNSENPIGRVIHENLSLISNPQVGIVAGVDVAAGSDRSEFIVARRGFPEDAARAFRQEFMGEFPEEECIPLRTELTVLEADSPPRMPIGFTVQERIGTAVQEQENRVILAALDGTFTNQREPLIPRPVAVPVPEPVQETFIRRTRFERIIDDTDELYPL